MNHVDFSHRHRPSLCAVAGILLLTTMSPEAAQSQSEQYQYKTGERLYVRRNSRFSGLKTDSDGNVTVRFLSENFAMNPRGEIIPGEDAEPPKNEMTDSASPKDKRFYSEQQFLATLQSHNEQCLIFKSGIPNGPLSDITPVGSLKAWEPYKNNFGYKLIFSQPVYSAEPTTIFWVWGNNPTWRPTLKPTNAPSNVENEKPAPQDSRAAAPGRKAAGGAKDGHWAWSGTLSHEALYAPISVGVSIDNGVFRYTRSRNGRTTMQFNVQDVDFSKSTIGKGNFDINIGLVLKRGAQYSYDSSETNEPKKIREWQNGQYAAVIETPSQADANQILSALKGRAQSGFNAATESSEPLNQLTPAENKLLRVATLRDQIQKLEDTKQETFRSMVSAENSRQRSAIYDYRIQLDARIQKAKEELASLTTRQGTEPGPMRSPTTGYPPDSGKAPISQKSVVPRAATAPIPGTSAPSARGREMSVEEYVRRAKALEVK